MSKKVEQPKKEKKEDLQPKKGAKLHELTNEYKMLEAKIKELEGQLAKSQEEASKNWDLLLRAKAEEDNIRRRAKIDVEHAHKYGIEKFAKAMLDILDSLERGLSVTDEQHDVQAVAEGMQLTHKLFNDNLSNFGIEVIDPINQQFDPNLHEALSMQVKNDVAANQVITVVQKGARLYDRVLRPARVIVSRAEK